MTCDDMIRTLSKTRLLPVLSWVQGAGQDRGRRKRRGAGGSESTEAENLDASFDILLLVPMMLPTGKLRPPEAYSGCAFFTSDHSTFLSCLLMAIVCVPVAGVGWEMAQKLQQALARGV